MSCNDNGHLWTARFYDIGTLAFWFCSRCGEVDRDTSTLTEPLEDVPPPGNGESGAAVNSAKPPCCLRRWELKDGSILTECDPCSVSFAGKRIPELSAAHEYRLVNPVGEVIREYKADRERASSHEGSFILTRYQAENDQLVKYRIHCNRGEPTSDEASSIAIISDLKPVEALEKM